MELCRRWSQMLGQFVHEEVARVAFLFENDGRINSVAGAGTSANGGRDMCHWLTRV